MHRIRLHQVNSGKIACSRSREIAVCGRERLSWSSSHSCVFRMVSETGRNDKPSAIAFAQLNERKPRISWSSRIQRGNSDHGYLVLSKELVVCPQKSIPVSIRITFQRWLCRLHPIKLLMPFGSEFIDNLNCLCHRCGPKPACTGLLRQLRMAHIPTPCGHIGARVTRGKLF